MSPGTPSGPGAAVINGPIGPSRGSRLACPIPTRGWNDQVPIPPWQDSAPIPRRTALKPLFERLETRSLLSLAITVNTAADENDPTDGALSLREAIELSNGTLPSPTLSAAERRW